MKGVFIRLGIIEKKPRRERGKNGESF